jgi:tetrapyrrole methylase family protein/MazG family protein
LRLACQSGVREEVIDELGDLLFAVVNLSRFLDVQPELALGGTIKKFMDRFRYIECKAKDLGKTVQEMSLAELDCLWEEAKNLKKNNEKAGNFLF